MYLDQKVIWITGASSGIGEALALELAKMPVKLVLSARRKDELDRVALLTGLPSKDILFYPRYVRYIVDVGESRRSY
jgi:NADP-dependent 3-hydroxy acid dehydrogenase YdfG